MYIENNIEILEELDILLYLKIYLTEQIKDKETVNNSIPLIISIFENNSKLIDLLKDKFGDKLINNFKFDEKFKENLILHLNERFENDYKNNVFQQIILSPYVSNKDKINLYKTYIKFDTDDFTEIIIDICLPNFSFNSLKEYIENIIQICDEEHIFNYFYNNTSQNLNIINQLSFINEVNFAFIFQTIEYNKDINELNKFLKETLLILSKELWENSELEKYNNTETISTIMERTIFILESLFKNDFLIQNADINILNKIRNQISKFKRNHEINNLYNVIKWENYSSTKIIDITDREIKKLLSLPNFNNNIELQKKIFPHLKSTLDSKDKYNYNQLHKTIQYIVSKHKTKNINMNKFLDFLTIYSNEIINNNNYIYDYLIKELNISNDNIPERIKTIFSSNENDFEQTFNKILLNMRKSHFEEKESLDLLILYFNNPFFMKYVYGKSKDTFLKISKYIKEGVFENKNSEHFLSIKNIENKNLIKIETTQNDFLENYIAEEIKTILYKKIFELSYDLSDYNYSKEVFQLLINNYKFIEEKSEGSLLRIYNKCSEKEMIDFFKTINIEEESAENLKFYKDNLLNDDKSRFDVTIKENIIYIQEKIKIKTNLELVIYNKDKRLEILIVKDKIKKESVINFNF